MRVIYALTFFVSLLIAGGVAQADRWDSKGWVKLGERAVNGRVDKDTIAVGRHEGKFTKLTIVVEKSDLELLDFEVVFANNERFNPNVRHYFKENSRTRVIDLPGDERMIKSINLKYKNLPGGGSATVEVWGWKSDDGPGRGKPHGGGGGWSFDSRGWTLLGERAVNGRMDKDRISVGRYKGKFQKLTLVVLDSDLELLDFEIKFDRGPAWQPGLRHSFREGARSHAIDFPGDERTIKFIDMKYKNTPGGGNAKIQVWAK
jgi:hypothetical protein